ncbi:hypothetical protein PACILC2_12480 [Paenibacillus cisolokensis]|uniref:Uncharacterized protein n=1 Tax=Paenibacillus cisolokensis TaxID=1658519 RepID=A0ABQ4N3F0_9BACL|nr:hypothetical protein PACILC2_12480 [Paenibacillus cisolokensis]
MAFKKTKRQSAAVRYGGWRQCSYLWRFWPDAGERRAMPEAAGNQRRAKAAAPEERTATLGERAEAPAGKPETVEMRPAS